MGILLTAETAAQGSGLESLLLMVVMYAVVIAAFYFIFMRPQKKEEKKLKALIAALEIGDYVLTGGELPAMVIVDAVSRYVDGVINTESLKEESFSSGMLEYPQYTRPEQFMGHKVPEVLLSGHHKNIENWRKEKSLETTKKNRPDLLGE